MRLPIVLAALSIAALSAAEPPNRIKVRISWGHEQLQPASYYVKLVPSGPIEVQQATGYALEAGESYSDGAWQTRAGAGDTDGVEFTLAHHGQPARRIDNLHIIWSDLIAAGDPDTARRLSRDPALLVDPAKLTVQMNRKAPPGLASPSNNWPLKRRSGFLRSACI